MQSKTPDKKAPAGASPAPAANRTKGILFILSAAFFFSLMTVFVRLSGDVPTMQKAFFRNIVAAFLAAFILMRSGEKFYIPRTSLMDMFLRCSIGTMGILCNFWAVDHMRIADANILNKLSPFFAILMSIFILKERPNRVEWLSVLLAFIGAAFVAKPGAGIASFPALVAILGGFTAGTAYTYVRKLGLSGVKGPVIVFSFSVFSTLILLPNILLNYHPMSVRQFVFLVLAGCSAAIAQLSVTAAYQNAPARDISVFDYSQVVYAAMFGFLLWGEIPDALSFLGYAIIIGTAFGKWYWMTKRSPS
ncbi:MAG: DMT family transporter [Lachnospiraceae bacterium]|nr:DMT family transporter [Lachnospiraceae bacterium]